MKKTKMLKKNYEFKNVLSKGKCIYGKNIIAYVLKNNSRTDNYLGIAISTKIGKAVRRNHLKRLIREGYKFYESRILAGNTIVFLWNRKMDVQSATYQGIKQDMNYIFKKAKIYLDDETQEIS